VASVAAAPAVDEESISLLRCLYCDRWIKPHDK
jgi:hypothetical protein